MKLVLKKPITTKSAFDNVKNKAEALPAEATPDEIDTVLNSVAQAQLGPVGRDQIIDVIRMRTKVSRTALREQLSKTERGLGHATGDQAHHLAELVLEKNFNSGEHLTFCLDGRFRAYNSRYWALISDTALGQVLLAEARLAFPETRNLNSLVNNARRLLANMLATDDDLFNIAGDPLPIVNCHNGEVWIDTDGKPTLKPHSASSRLTSCLPISYDPTASCPKLDATLSEIFSKASDPEDMVRHWHEVGGYAIQPRRDIACFILLHGGGSDGKSKLLQTLQKLVGAASVLNGRIAKFQHDAFGIATLVGKLLFVDDDLAIDTKLDDGLLKMISEEKQMTTRHAHGPSFSFRCRALPIMAGNHFPSTADSSYGMTRRAIVIPFDRQFAEDEADIGLFEKIWASELPGILNRSLEGTVPASTAWRVRTDRRLQARRPRLHGEREPADRVHRRLLRQGPGRQHIPPGFPQGHGRLDF